MEQHNNQGYQIVFKKTASKELEILPKTAYEAVKKAILALAIDPIPPA